jgi:putative transcription factor
MQCEMCGETIRGSPKLVRVEGAELQVCSKCEKFGTEVQQVRRTGMAASSRPPVQKQGRPGATVATPSAFRKRDLFDYMEGEIVDDYAARIRHAREAKALSQKDLAMLLKEKEHLIKKIENAELIPEDAVRKKLEKALEIRLVDAPEADADKKVQSKLTPTLGDLTIIRKVKK